MAGQWLLVTFVTGIVRGGTGDRAGKPVAEGSDQGEGGMLGKLTRGLLDRHGSRPNRMRILFRHFALLF